MDVLQAIQSRRSIRSYLTRPVEEEKLDKVLEAARLAPSARNRQNWKFIVVQDAVQRERLKKAAYDQDFVGEAPVVIVACGTDPSATMTCGHPCWPIDTSIALSFMLLEAWEQGLGTCWLGRFDESRVKEILGIPPEFKVVGMTPLGYPAEIPSSRPRKELKEIVCFDRYAAES